MRWPERSPAEGPALAARPDRTCPAEGAAPRPGRRAGTSRRGEERAAEAEGPRPLPADGGAGAALGAPLAASPAAAAAAPAAVAALLSTAPAARHGPARDVTATGPAGGGGSAGGAGAAEEAGPAFSPSPGA